VAICKCYGITLDRLAASLPEKPGSLARIKKSLKDRTTQTYNASERNFCTDVLNGFCKQAIFYEAFVFCMSEHHVPPPARAQDVLSLWRGYGHDGRGLCLSFDAGFFKNYAGQALECRLSRVIYNEQLQEQVIAYVIDEGWKRYSASPTPNSAVEMTIVALMFVMPTMKDKSFEEEKEWRFIYVPEAGDPVNSKRQFRASDDGLLVPYYLLSDVLGWPQSPKPALPIKEIATGPSPHQELNIRSLQYLKLATVRDSLIPYRGR
jgi:hypothetical protein